MRLWHKDLIPFLPNEQLLGQWRECCAIASLIRQNGTPNHILVNKVMDYSMDHFYTFSIELVYGEMIKRNFTVKHSLLTFCDNLAAITGSNVYKSIDHEKLFQGWHTTRYLQQCLLNLEEKADCGGVSYADWLRIANGVKNMSQLCSDTYECLFV